MKPFAVAALPYEKLGRTTRRLRAELRRQPLSDDVHKAADWDTFAVTGPQQFTNLRRGIWFEYRATVE